VNTLRWWRHQQAGWNNKERNFSRQGKKVKEECQQTKEYQKDPLLGHGSRCVAKMEFGG
jgi:hypothetical protein